MPILAILFTGGGGVPYITWLVMEHNEGGRPTKPRGVGFKHKVGQYPKCKGILLLPNRVGSWR